MKVYICKFFNEKDRERKIARLVSREKKRTGNNLRVFCIDEPIRKRLEVAGISSEIADEIQQRIDIDDNDIWGRAYELSDELHASVENNDRLQYSGINFLTLEFSMSRYVWLIKLSNLCQRMLKQNCQTLILVLTKPSSLYSSSINTAKIKMVMDGNIIKHIMLAKPWHYLMGRYLVRLGYLLPRFFLIWMKEYTRKLVRKGYTASTRQEGQKGEKVLFFVSTPLYARAALAICGECLRNGLVPFVISTGEETKTVLQRYELENRNRSHPMLWPSVMSKIPLLVSRLIKHVNSFYKNRRHLDVSSEEFSATYLCQRELVAELPQLCIGTAYTIALLERLIKVTSPNIICLMPDGGVIQQITSAIAKKYNIPTLACSAAFETGNARSYMRHLHADKLAAMGEVIKNIYVESGVEPERIVATGIAHYDLLFKRDGEQDKQVLLGCGVDLSKKFVLFTTDNIAFSETEKMLTGVIETILKMKDFQLVVKVHPAEDIALYQRMAEKYDSSKICVVKDVDLYALITNCELLITKYSACGLEAMMADKPVVTINLPGQLTPVPYAEEGAALGVYHYEDIEPAILKALYDEETRIRFKAGRDRFVRNWACAADGKASQRIVNLMKEMIDNQRTKARRLHAAS